jgi:hypothetical protein
MGQGLGFLHEAPWLAGRLLHCAAVADVLLAELTPDGVTLDAMAGFDVRHGERGVAWCVKSASTMLSCC